MSKILKIAFISPLITLCFQQFAYAASLETNVCIENQSAQNVGIGVVSYSPAKTWDGSPNQALQLRFFLFPGMTQCTRLELPITTSEDKKPYIKLTINKGPEIYLLGGTGKRTEKFEKDDGIRWEIRFDKSPGYDSSLIGEFYPDETSEQRSYAVKCSTGNQCNKFIIPPEFNRPFKK